MKTIVFDFDKTLTDYDTLTDLFLRLLKERVYLFPLYFFLKCLSKIGFISVKKEKEIMINVLLKNKDEGQLFLDFSKTIKLNKIKEILQQLKKNGERVIILSASPENYLKLLFPDCLVFGLIYQINNGHYNITQHPYGKEKPQVLIKHGISHFDELYYDSVSDEYLFYMCNKANKVLKGQIIQEKSLLY